SSPLQVDSTSTSQVKVQAATGPVKVESSPPARGSTNLAYQIQQLQQEVLVLRGLVEEQSFELKRLKKQRLDDYLDLDKRLVEFSNKKSQPSPDTLPATVAESTAGNSQNEKTLYSQGIESLLNQQNYSEAKQKFNEYLLNYPEGMYVPNVYYWQGQILLKEDDLKTAERSFKSLIDRYPDHQKTPDAKYKLATIYFNQGKKAEAKSLLDDVASSDSDVARLAISFLSNQFN
ncbi:MAG: tol-pal system protein YbgF, partial [Cellvibrionaceae bacterium]